MLQLSMVNPTPDADGESFYIHGVKFVGLSGGSLSVVRLTVSHHNQNVDHVISVPSSRLEVMVHDVFQRQVSVGRSRLVRHATDGVQQRGFRWIFVHEKLVMGRRCERLHTNLDVVGPNVKCIGEFFHKV